MITHDAQEVSLRLHSNIYVILNYGIIHTVIVKNVENFENVRN